MMAGAYGALPRSRPRLTFSPEVYERYPIFFLNDLGLFVEMTERLHKLYRIAEVRIVRNDSRKTAVLGNKLVVSPVAWKFREKFPHMVRVFCNRLRRRFEIRHPYFFGRPFVHIWIVGESIKCIFQLFEAKIQLMQFRK